MLKVPEAFSLVKFFLKENALKDKIIFIIISTKEVVPSYTVLNAAPPCAIKPYFRTF